MEKCEIMKLLKRKIDSFLVTWKNNPDKMPLIVKGARQIGKTESITAWSSSILFFKKSLNLYSMKDMR